MKSPGCCQETAEEIDAILDVLGHHVRRAIVRYFEKVVDAATATLDEVVSHVTDRFPDRDQDDLSIAIVHKHLPALESAGWLEFDQRSKEIRYHGHESARDVLEKVPELFSE